MLVAWEIQDQLWYEKPSLGLKIKPFSARGEAKDNAPCVQELQHAIQDLTVAWL